VKWRLSFLALTVIAAIVLLWIVLLVPAPQTAVNGPYSAHRETLTIAESGESRLVIGFLSPLHGSNDLPAS
jgi:predicted MFS family arabinose efflux permease